jgi:hypothetical protein
MLMKNMIMFPWNRSGVFVVLYGDQGTGKGWLVNTLAKRIYGDNSPLFRSVTNADHVFGHYSLDGENECLMMFFDETEINTKAHIASLKNATTETNRNANYKFKAQAQVQTWWQGFLATNSPTPVLIKGNERRIFVVCTKLIENTVFPQWIQSIVNDPLVFDLWLGKICSSYPEVTDQWHAQTARPQTFAYHNLKVRSFSPLSSWWLDCMRRGWHTKEPTTDDRPYYSQHQNTPSLVWINNTDDDKWNDLVGRHWLFQSYYLQTKDFVTLRGYNKGQPDDPLMKFLSELIPMIHGPKFGLTNLPEQNTLLRIPDLKTCVINFCKFHFISDPSVLHIRGVNLPPNSIDLDEESKKRKRDPWEGMKDIFDKKLKRKVNLGTILKPPKPTPIQAKKAVVVTPPLLSRRKEKEPESEEEEEEEIVEMDTNDSPLYEEEEDSFIDDSFVGSQDDEVVDALNELHQIHSDMGVDKEEEEEVLPPHQPETEEEFNDRYAKKMQAQVSLLSFAMEESKSEDEEDKKKEKDSDDEDEDENNNPFVFNL